MGLRENKVVSEELFNVHRESRLKSFKTPEEAESEAKSEDVAETPASDVETHRKAGADRGSAMEPSASDAGSTVVEPALEAGTDAGEGHPRPAPEGPQSTGGSTAKADQPAKSSRPTKSAKPKRETVAKDETVQLRIMIPRPAAGASSTFDSLVELHGEKTAFRLVMRKALDDYAKLVLNGGLAKAPNEYPQSSSVVDTSRIFPRDAYERAVSEFDPMGVASDRLMSTTIARRALAAFIASDRG
jgi:hypothetical protein